MVFFFIHPHIIILYISCQQIGPSVIRSSASESSNDDAKIHLLYIANNKNIKYFSENVSFSSFSPFDTYLAAKKHWRAYVLFLQHFSPSGNRCAHSTRGRTSFLEKESLPQKREFVWRNSPHQTERDGNRLEQKKCGHRSVRTIMLKDEVLRCPCLSLAAEAKKWSDLSIETID